MSPVMGSFNPGDPVNILLVDDHMENLMALRAILERSDYRLVTATSGSEALKRLLRDEFALILLDVMMPEMDGYEIASRIKERESNRYTPIIFLTAVAKDIEHIFKGYAVGAVDYLLKPLASEVVKAKVEVFVDLYRQSKEIQRQSELITESERKEKEYRLAALKRSQEKRFQDLANSIPQIVWTSKSDGVLSYCNERWFEYTGFNIERSHGTGWIAAVHPDDKDRAQEAWELAVSTGKVFEFEFRFRRARDGAYRWFLSRAIPNRDEEGRVVEWFGTCTDIEEQKRAEFELQETLRSRDEFLSITSHELKTPVTSLKLQLQLLSRNAKKDPNAAISAQTVQERLVVANRQTDRLEHLIENLLDISRIRSRRLGIERERLDLAELVREVASRFSEQLKSAGCLMTVSADTPIEGPFDRTRIEQVLTNLISNAIKYGGGKPIEVRLISDSSNGATLSVEDHGIGISEADLERIFQRFERAVSSKDFTGLGLGLFVTQQIVQAHGGTIDVVSKSGQGSIFKVHLPVEILAEVPTQPSGEESTWTAQRERKSS